MLGKRKHDATIEDLLPVKRPRIEHIVEFLDLPNELLRYIGDQCDDDTRNKLACTSTVLHRVLTWDQPFFAEMQLPGLCPSILARVTHGVILPFANRLRTRPWWRPSEFRLTLGEVLRCEHKPEFSVAVENFYLERAPLIVSFLEDALGLIATRVAQRTLIMHMCSLNVAIQRLAQILSKCTQVHLRSAGFLPENLAYSSALRLSFCGTVILCGPNLIESANLLNGFEECKQLCLCSQVDVSPEEIARLKCCGVDVQILTFCECFGKCFRPKK